MSRVDINPANASTRSLVDIAADNVGEAVGEEGEDTEEESSKADTANDFFKAMRILAAFKDRFPKIAAVTTDLIWWTVVTAALTSSSVTIMRLLGKRLKRGSTACQKG